MSPGPARPAPSADTTEAPAAAVPARRRRWAPVLGTLVGLALAYLLLRGRGEEVLTALRSADPLLVAVAGLVLLLANVVRAQRLRLLLPSPRMPVPAAVEVTTFYNLVTGIVPGGLGELALPVRLARRHGVPRAEAASVLLLTRLLDVLGLLGAATLSAVLAPDLGDARLPVVLVCAGALAAATVLTVRLDTVSARALPRLDAAAGGTGWRATLARRVASLLRALAGQHGRVDAVALLCTAGLWAGTWTALVLLTRAVEVDFPFAAGGLLMAVVFLLTAVPVPALAGIGLQDVGWVLALTLLAGVAHGPAVGAAFALHGLTLLLLAAVAVAGAATGRLGGRRVRPDALRPS